MLDPTTVAVNRYAPIGSEEIHLYSNGFEGGSGLTIGQLAIAVSMRSAAVYEAQSVLKMNKMSSGTLKLDKASEYMKQLANEEMSDWATARAYLIREFGMGDEDLPETVNTYMKRMEAINSIKAKIDQLTQQQQTNMIDLQTLVNRRDVAYSTSSNIVRTLGTSMNRDVANFA